MRPLPTRYHSLPPEISMDYRMTEDNLWAVWTKNYPNTQPEVLQGVALASPGTAGPQEILQADDGTLCALSLSQLRTIVQDLTSSKPSFRSKFPAWLGGEEQYAVIMKASNSVGIIMMITEATSSEECFAQVLAKNPHAEIMWAVPTAPLIALKDKLENILANEDYEQVGNDWRANDEKNGHPKDWLRWMKGPRSHQKFKEAQKYFEEHPGAWEAARTRFLEKEQGDTGADK